MFLLALSEGKLKICQPTDAEIRVILGRKDELERIVKSAERRSKKWENAKEIIKWITDKGIDVEIALLLLLLQIK